MKKFMIHNKSSTTITICNHKRILVNYKKRFSKCLDCGIELDAFRKPIIK